MKKILKLIHKLSFFGIIIGTAENAEAMLRGLSQPGDPLFTTNYREAFDQKKIHIKFKHLMITQQCAENVFGFEEQKQDTNFKNKASLEDEVPSSVLKSRNIQHTEKTSLLSQQLKSPVYNLEPGHHLTSPLVSENLELPYRTSGNIQLIQDTPNKHLERLHDESEWEKYEKICLEKLKKARRWAIIENARDTAITLCLVDTITGCVAWELGVDTYAGGMLLYGGLINSAWYLSDISKAVFNLWFTPAHPLDEFEKQFAITQCFIPKDLWPALVKDFMSARQNPFSQQQSMNRIEFTLGLTTYRPKPPIKLTEGNSLATQTISTHHILGMISKNMDEFFKGYEKMDPLEYNTLKANVSKFVFSLVGKNTLPRYIYLHGPGGIGKTYFTHQLYEWVEKHIPGGIHFESLVITSAEELEGSADKPGAFLRVLRNQCLTKKHGSVVFMDEADWLDNTKMISSVKRVFNGKLAKLSTAFFGSGMDGTGVHLAMPPMLIVLAGNNPINDLPLRGRFDIINFPSPTENALMTYGQKVFEQSIRDFESSSRPTSLYSFDPKSIKGCNNFRAIDSIIPAIISQYMYDN